MALTKILLATLMGLMAVTHAQQTSQNSTVKPKTGPIDFEKNPYDEKEYFKGIPDLINMPRIQFRYKLIRSLLQGFEREMYMNKAIVLDPDCFSDFYVQKQNEYKYLYQ
jgi:hypothetical protein